MAADALSRASPAATMINSRVTSSHRRERSGRPVRAATTVSMISLATHSVVMGTTARSSRTATVAAVYPRWVSHTRRINWGMARSAWNLSRHVGAPRPPAFGGCFIKSVKLLLIVDILRVVRHHLNQLHHAPVFMNQDVAVNNVLAGEVHKAAAHPEVAGNCDGASRITSSGTTGVLLDVGRALTELCTDGGRQGVLTRGGNRERVPPYPGRGELFAGLPGF